MISSNLAEEEIKVKPFLKKNAIGINEINEINDAFCVTHKFLKNALGKNILSYTEISLRLYIILVKELRFNGHFKFLILNLNKKVFHTIKI